MALGETLSLVDGWLYLVHRQNPGVAFSMLADLPDALAGPRCSRLVSLVGVVLFGRILLPTGDPIVRGAAAVVIAGALGNLGDRAVNGHVTDFVLVRFFPFVFNLADAAITVGGILLAAAPPARGRSRSPRRCPITLHAEPDLAADADRLSRRFQTLPPYPLADVPALKRELRARGVDIIDLGVGDADLPPPPAGGGAPRAAAGDPANSRYAFQLGLPAFRQAIAALDGAALRRGAGPPESSSP